MEQKQESFAGRVRDAAKKLGEFTASDLAGAIGVMDRTEKRHVSLYIRDFISRGEMERVNPVGPAQRSVGCQPCEERYRYVGKTTRITNRQRLWDVIRRMNTPSFALSDLVQLTGIKYAQVKRFCRWLHDQGWAQRVSPGHFRRLKGVGVDVPVDKHESDRRIAFREAKRAEALEALERVREFIESIGH